MLPRNVLYYGREEPLPERVPLCAGPLSLIYQAGDLRTIKLGDREVLRRVYVALRDRNWGTVPARLSDVRIESAPDSFRITYTAEHAQGDAHAEDCVRFSWQGTIAGDAEGTITFSMAGVAGSTFLRNRIGFCVLHPMRECAGQPCVVEHVEGTRRRATHGAFPEHISPHQPFLDMRAISHQVVPGVWAQVRLEGDTFEMEDQRNWTDASFKIYSTPLSLPFPAMVEEGTRIEQRVTLSLEGQPPDLLAGTAALHPQRGARVPSRATLAPRSRGPVTLTVGDEPLGPVPRIGLGVASHGQALGVASHRQALDRLRALHLAHLRVDLTPSQTACEATLRRAAAEARALGVSLEVALHLSGDADRELAQLRALVDEVSPRVCRWLVFPERWAALARERLVSYDPAAQVGSGTNLYFAELNRERPQAAALDVVCYSINPQVHAFDEASLAETLETQGVTLRSARHALRVEDTPLAVTPVTLRPRFDPHAEGEPPAASGELRALPSAVDVRQMSLFGAVWTAGSLKYLSQGGAHSVTYYETTGWRGVMERKAGSPLPDLFRSLPGAVFPLYHVLADAGEYAGGEVVPVLSSDHLAVDGLVMERGGRRRAILANLTGEPQAVRVQGLGARVRVRSLDERNAEDAMRWPERFRAQEGDLLETDEGALACELMPYGVLRVDG